MKSLNVERALHSLGSDLRTARIRRRMSVDDLAQRAGMNRKTLMRLEKGDEGVSIGALGRVLLILGEEKRLADLLDPAKDETGLLLDQERLPSRVRSRRDPIAQEQLVDDFPEDDDGYGMGF
ncbi:Xre family transcriptional regulator [Rhodovulum bhavnagarense]|uniref:Xre family transcriptional regulator n=1 Tax=Rhodovulum bhavnagarense TaxID=992286 RepID=A0A4R2RNP4_9RHOB|nr:helix-turn-helix domain-containing protein [Rhodovulum bhavnagarense]TCP61421.1 Xre family transcriptional regulator [Rhodovulum bhavnagarense]